MTRGISYKFTLLKHYIIRSSEEIGHKYFLENQILIRVAGLERELNGLLQDTILEIGYLKLLSYSHFKIKFLKSRKTI